MKVKTLFFMFFACSLFLQAQLVVDGNPPYNTAQNLVENVLLGAGVTANNIQYTGDQQAIGFFDGTNSNIGLDSGLILCSGQINVALGPNNAGGQTSPPMGLGLPGHPLLQGLIPNHTTNDASVLQFDFIPSSDTLKFRYVFGSEEYMEYVNSSYNDVFGFFLTGPNPTGGTYNNVNIAQIPGTTMPVTIDNVNNFINAQYYFDNENPPGQTVQFDGFTIPLTAQAHVVCGQTYTITIAIADAGDHILDSGVFLEASSFSSPGGITINTSATFFTGTADTSLVEGCSFATIDIVRTGDLADTILVYASYSGTATNGVDFALLPDTFYLFPNMSTYTLQLDPIFDNTTEPIEDFIMSFTPVLSTPIDTNCFSVSPAIAGFTITDANPLLLTVSPDIVLDCPGDTVSISAALTGGNGNNIITWNTGFVTSGDVSTSSFNVIPSTSTTYIVTATDTCGAQILTDSIQVVVPNFQPLLGTLQDTVVCPGENIVLNPGVIGGDGSYTYTWSTGDTTSTLSLAPLTDSLYILNIVDGCEETLNNQSFVSVSTPPIADYQHIIQSDYGINFTNTSFGGAFFNWDFGDGNTSSQPNPIHYYSEAGTYLVSLFVHNQDGCVDTVFYTIELNPEYTFYLPNAFSPDGNGINDHFFGKGEGFINYKMYIFDRWGEKVFYTKEQTKQWGGFLPNGKKAKSDVYTYKVILELPLNETKELTGNVTLIR